MENSLKTTWIQSEKKLGQYRIALLNWFDEQRRDLPWRQDPSLYKTVVSEFMLQQTRVSTVIPYFKNWLNKFPDFYSLSQADEKEVLKAWEGLGYYSRARNLHQLSKTAANWKHPPVSVKEWQTLPGVGPYIAAAVTSISLDQPEAVCDGNVVRVLSRLFAISEIFKDGATAQKKLRPLAQKLINSGRPGDYNQAVMELGATYAIVHLPCAQPARFFPTVSRADKETGQIVLRSPAKQKKQPVFGDTGLSPKTVC